MDKRINDLKDDFNKVVDLKNENVKMFEMLDFKIKNLKNVYSDFIKNNKQQLFIFGLDSFHFQGKLIDLEYDDMKRLYFAIKNRIYCEYFKLYKIVIEYINENINDDTRVLELVKVNNNFPIYKDLEPFKQYEFEVIQNIHETIIGLLISINNYLMHKEHDLRQHQEKNATGLNIDNFIRTFTYNNVVLREKITLFITYIEFFHKLHTKYFKRFTTKMQLFVSQINNDIKFEDSSELNKSKKQTMLENFANDNLDKNILKALKNSVVGEGQQTPFTPPSTPVSGIESLYKPAVEINSVILKITEAQSVEQSKPLEQEQEQEENSDEVSLLTTDSESKKEESSPSEVQAQKPKRKYTPRKKKTDI